MPTIAELAAAARSAQDQYTTALNDIKTARDTARSELRKFAEAVTTRIGNPQAPTPSPSALNQAMGALAQAESKWQLADPIPE